MKKRIQVILLLIILLPACGRDTVQVLAPQQIPSDPSPDSIILAQCMLLEDAVEAFAAADEDMYPLNIDTDTLATGESVLDLMPDGGIYINPYTEEETLPVNGRATEPGMVGYESSVVGDLVVGYSITGFGEDSLEVEIADQTSSEDEQLLLNCMAVTKAADDFYEYIMSRPPTNEYRNLYPLDEDRNERISLVSAWVTMLANWGSYYFNFDFDQPEFRTAESPGETGYVTIIKNNRAEGYVVTGYGTESLIYAHSSYGCSKQEAVVISNCRTLEKALMQYAWENRGLYPSDPYAESNLAGKTVMDYLHDPAGLINPYSGERTGPVAAAIGSPGEICYEVIEHLGLNLGYRITGIADDGPIIELTDIEAPQEAAVRYNCHMLLDAVERFAEGNDGRYPQFIFSSEQNLRGETLIDLLPRQRAPLNPYTREDDGFVDHTAASAGQVGYACIEGYYTSSYVRGFVITGHSEYGWEFAISNLPIRPIEAVVMSHCRTVILAAMEFARQNYGYFPRDVGVDATPHGDTLTRLLPGGILLLNPTTGWHTEPVDGVAATEGQVGYIPIMREGVCQGCCVTGVAEISGCTTITLLIEPPTIDRFIDRR